MAKKFFAAVIALALLGCCRQQPGPAETNAAAKEPPLANAKAAATDGDTVAEALRAKLVETGDGFGTDTRYLVAFSDLDKDGSDEALLYLIDPGRCGPLGCALFVLQPDGNGGWAVRNAIGPSKLPVYRLDHRTDKWADLGVTIVSGGKRQLMAVPHGAQGYAADPNAPPIKAANKVGATLLITDDEAKSVTVVKR
ncbi:MAG: hypothetical protein ABIR63_06540 [Sphingomicrobium sp.]